MSPAELMDTPRIYTALAEWAACLIYILILKKKISGFKLGAALTVMLGLMAVYQYIAGLLPLYLWIPGMLGAIGLMYLNILLVCDISRIDAGYCCIRAFVLAEFAASFQWQIYVWLAVRFQKDSRLISILVLLCSYALVYVLYYFLEKAHMPEDERLIVGPKEFVGAASIAIGAFIMSNISFVMPDTPFSSATSSILYVRTLVDFGGLVMLFAQQDKREEFRMRSENQAMNIVLQRQYDQYRLAQDNMELLRREFHDLKHYLIAIRSEDDPDKREQYLFEMENAILTQEALADTGNHVLDVVLTTKSTYCIQKNITFNCMADGKLLNFMHVKDICSIFGNALDNAIECVGQFENPEQRLITMDMYQKNHFLMIQFENYSENKLVLKDRFPITTKGNKMYHGYGLKSIQFAVQKYGGTMTVRSEGNWFKLHILIPID